ncbi:efflux RND transporter periplasmic adaptor subunit [Aurantimonas sp. 22II-16-19i]|uniref:efflux RND transporter periplasmic adaptor subunit n=1 Tax=Aurantimonas sp. 22II-16-19i TaxID=1317114 RepID=UPI0009F7B90B|nr:efflux RND transporter periplasmic adaptor subunit [Aurantimonas sp. 22II-16-19i]ORE91881.1 acriflavine resistance protein a [Aurantimonas sp. 22II-16-19i]
MSILRRLPLPVLLGAAAMLLGACTKEETGGAPADLSADPPHVAVVTVEPRRLVVTDELPGRVAALRTAEIRPQVTGIVQKVLFTEGSEVTADQPLFQIDPAPLAADVEAASAVLARAEADLLNANLKYERVQALSAARTASAAALGDATGALAQAKASVAEATANLTRRRLELAHATVRSPVAGRIGQALTTEGGLASVGGATALAVVQQLDRVYLDVRQPSIRREALEDMVASGRSEEAGTLAVDILTIAGKPYEFPGKVLFSESTVDPGTGSIGLRVEVPNPYRQLLPGMYLRAKVPSAVYPAALTVPQQAVQRDASGKPQLTILAPDNTATRRAVELGPLVERQYVILSGLSAGETVLVEGQDRAQPGRPLAPDPYRQAASPTEG